MPKPINFAFAIHFGCPKGNTKEDYGNEKEKKKSKETCLKSLY